MSILQNHALLYYALHCSCQLTDFKMSHNFEINLNLRAKGEEVEFSCFCHFQCPVDLSYKELLINLFSSADFGKSQSFF